MLEGEKVNYQYKQGFHIIFSSPDSYIDIRDNTVSIGGRCDDVCLTGRGPGVDPFIFYTNRESLLLSDEQLLSAEIWLVNRDHEVIDYRSLLSYPYRLALPEENNPVDDVYQTISLGEGLHVEFKSYIDIQSGKSDQLLKTVCAFSNANNGTLFIGVNDDGSLYDFKKSLPYKAELTEALGLYCQDIKKYLSEELVFNSCFDVTFIMMGHIPVVKVNVTRTEKPNYIRSSRQAFIRRGASNMKMPFADHREDYLKGQIF
nr:ATP-binding protein [Sessilibacter corallicola]